MKLQVERDPLAEAVAWTARALPARPTAPVLAGMRLQAGNELTLSTFDYEVSAQSTIQVQADEPGTVLVSGMSGSVGYSSSGSSIKVNVALPHLTVVLVPSVVRSTGLAGSDRTISASSRPDTSTVPGSSACTGIVD